MDLLEYMNKNNLNAPQFAKITNLSYPTIRNALKGYEISLSSALQIEEVTHGRVKCTDLKPKIKRVRK